ncbi:MAG TPA: D-alanine--D-alanine ligase [Planctomycetota bacterium]|nr:D-alanine--D-alanine ligase [Planctomycetota bacterium]HRR81232.1 D-alanine--D-alanine ligase [Planctomycetota bacterium]HRT93537.1 D-alanine--D-alanine ligase [Planctomycetota bacterium]
MRIGLTYDLRRDYLAEGYSEEETAEFDRPDTIEAIEGALRELGHETDRIGHARALVARLAAGGRWDLVFNIAEGLRGFGREAQVPAILDVYGIPYTFSDPLVLALSLHKGMTNRVVRDLGLPVADFAVVADEADLARVAMPYPLFVKPVAEGTGKGITNASRVSTPAELAAACRAIWQRLAQPALVETYLPGRELTVGIVGTGRDAEAIGALEIVLLEKAEAHAYSYQNKELCEELVRYVLVEDALAEEAKALALAAWRGLGCRDAGRVDVRAGADGRLRFLEVNPLAGLHPHHSDLPILCTQRGIPYVRLIQRIVESALHRRGPAR